MAGQEATGRGTGRFFGAIRVPALDPGSGIRDPGGNDFSQRRQLFKPLAIGPQPGKWERRRGVRAAQPMREERPP